MSTTHLTPRLTQSALTSAQPHKEHMATPEPAVVFSQLSVLVRRVWQTQKRSACVHTHTCTHTCAHTRTHTHQGCADPQQPNHRPHPRPGPGSAGPLGRQEEWGSLRHFPRLSAGFFAPHSSLQLHMALLTAQPDGLTIINLHCREPSPSRACLFA